MSEATTAAEPAAAGPLLWDISDLQRETGFSERKLWSLRAAGSMPQPLRVGRSVRWRRADIEAWVAAGCPDLSKAGRLENQQDRLAAARAARQAKAAKRRARSTAAQSN